MKTLTRLIIISIVLTITLAQTINTQGVLRDNNGYAVVDGDYNLTFKIYDAVDNGNEMWSGSYNTVSVVNGVFNVTLGEGTGISPITNLESNGSYWLGISVSTDAEMTPRLKLSLSPYEMAHVSGSENVFPGAGNVGIGVTSPNAKLEIGGSESTDEARLIFAASDASNRFTIETDLDGTETEDLLGFRTRLVDNILVLKGNGNVGIGTANPNNTLEVNGHLSTTTLGAGGLGITNSGYSSPNSSRIAWGDGSGWKLHFTQSDGEKNFTFVDNGKLGIATENPSTQLHINSSVDAGLGDYTGVLLIGDEDGVNIVMDNNEIIARNNGSHSTLYLNDALIIHDNNIGVNIGPDNAYAIKAGGSIKATGGIYSDYDVWAVGDIGMGDCNVWDGSNDYDLTWDGSWVRREGSSRRFKKNIKKSNFDFHKVLDLEIVEYEMKEEYGTQGYTHFGVIAEDVEELGLSYLVNQDKDGVPDGFKYKKLAIFQHEIIKENYNKIHELEAELAEIKEMIQNLK